MNMRKHVYGDQFQCLFGLEFESYVLFVFLYVPGTMLCACVCIYRPAISDYLINLITYVGLVKLLKLFFL